MRATPAVFVEDSSVSYTHVDYARLVKAQGAVVVVNDADEDGTARQNIIVPDGDVILGLGPNASGTPAALNLLRELGVRVLSTYGQTSAFDAFTGVRLAHRQAQAFVTDSIRADAARTLYAARFADSPLIEGAPLARLAALDKDLLTETYAKYAKRFAIARFSRGGSDPVNKAIGMTESLLLRTATDVIRCLGLSTALGVIEEDGHLAFAHDLVAAVCLDVTIPVGFQVGAQKLKERSEILDAVAASLHHHRIVPRMVTLATNSLAG